MTLAWLVLPPLLLAVIIHEVAHGVAALKLGDDTAKRLGRLTLNPLPHIDPMGTVIFPILQVLTIGHVAFGWAKPVPVQAMNLRKPLRDMAYVAIAGPLSNLIQAFLWAAMLWGILYAVPDLGLLLRSFAVTGELPDGYRGTILLVSEMAIGGVQINLVLMLFNLIPIPPLDGSRVLAATLPHRWAIEVYKLEKMGMIVMMMIIIFAPGVLFDNLIGPIMNVIMGILLP